MKILLPVDASHPNQRTLSGLAAHDELPGRGHGYVVFTLLGSVATGGLARTMVPVRLIR